MTDFDSTIKLYLNDCRQLIEKALDQYSHFQQSCPKRLQEAIRYSLLAPGKRLRPLLTLLASELCGGKKEKALPAAVAVEMIHCYSLIHDDLPAMDNDDLRRGRSTCHKQFDEATAILAGDALLTQAFEVLNNKASYKSQKEISFQDLSKIIVKSSFELAKAAGPCGMVGGQQDDILFSTLSQNVSAPLKEYPQSDDWSSEETFQLLERIHERKCAALIVAALKLGGISAGASDSLLNSLEKFGEAFGLLFQITDDILDCIGNEQTLGKRTQKDAEQGKLTFVTCLGLDKSRKIVEEQEKICLSLLKSFSDQQLPYHSLIYLVQKTKKRNK
ncbi:MAG: polyprenyl synthetase family protein [Planctomycetia bacterium]|nr:polyprenyl synthetase family protein [Planctomycetia bacterium]